MSEDRVGALKSLLWIVGSFVVALWIGRERSDLVGALIMGWLFGFAGAVLAFGQVLRDRRR